MASYQHIDTDNMHQSIYEFSDHLMQAVEIGKSISLKNQYNDIRNIIVAGMGGSAIGGDVAKLLCKNELKVPMVVSRNYTLPGWANENTLVICCSYSGNTEETLAAFEHARDKGAKIVGISTGGNLSEKMTELELDLVTIPSGFQPRAALAFSMVPMLFLLQKMGLIGTETINQLPDAASLIKSIRDRYGKQSDDNPTFTLAQQIYKTIPVIYGETDATGTLAVRFKGQLSENAKMLAYCNELPEMNHNEIVGFKNNQDILNHISVIWLKDKKDHPRTALRRDSTQEIISDLCANHEVLSAEGDSATTRFLHLIHYGDWLSYWCAILHRTDPTPVKNIDRLKAILSEKS